MIKYDIMEQQHRLDLDNKKIELEKSMLDINKEKNDEVSRIHRETEGITKKVKDEKLLWESQKIEMNQKNKLYQRKVDEMEERINELIKMNEELHIENTKMTIQLDEMRSVYRGKLLQFMNDQMSGENKSDGSDFFLLIVRSCIFTYDFRKSKYEAGLRYECKRRTHTFLQREGNNPQ